MQNLNKKVNSGYLKTIFQYILEKDRNFIMEKLK